METKTLAVGRRGSSSRPLSKEKGLFSKILSDEGDTPRATKGSPGTLQGSLRTPCGWWRKTTLSPRPAPKPGSGQGHQGSGSL